MDIHWHQHEISAVVQCLATDVINNDNFNPDKLWDFDIIKEMACLDSNWLLVLSSGTEMINGWSQVTVRCIKHSSETDSCTYTDYLTL